MEYTFFGKKLEDLDVRIMRNFVRTDFCKKHYSFLIGLFNNEIAKRLKDNVVNYKQKTIDEW
jgi:hypothetical protein